MNKSLSTLDLRGLDQFRPASLLADPPVGRQGQPSDISVDLIDFDPDQPRRTLSESGLQMLAESIGMHGVLEPVSLRTDRSAEGRYVVNRGERRVRAARIAGLKTVPAFMDERHDPFKQAVENLHREDMSPFDFAVFIAQREAEGYSRVEIARRLSKRKADITTVAALLDAPPEVREAYDSGRVRDLRNLYKLTTASRHSPESVRSLLQSGETIDRALVKSKTDRTPDLSSANPGIADKPDRRRPGRPSAPPRPSIPSLPSLKVEHDGRQGLLHWTGSASGERGTVTFSEEHRVDVRLSELKIMAWASPPDVS